MDFFKLKKPLAMLMIITMICAVFAVSVFGQQYPQAPGQGAQQYQGGGGGAYALPGLPGISLNPGTNTVALSVSIASQQDNQIFFQVNGFAIMDPGSQTGTAYTLSKACPGIIDTSTNQAQIEIDQLQSSIQSTTQASMNDLYSMLRPSVNSLMLLAQLSQQSTQGSQATFQVQSLTVIAPDGQATPFNLNNPMSVVVDSSSMRVYTVVFPQMYDFINTYITNVENNYYTTIINNIVYQPVIVVTPPVVYPIITPIAFPSYWPIYYPVPVPVPMPIHTVTPKPKPSKKPSVSPSIKPSVSPSGKPSGSPTVSPSGKPSVSPSGKPSVTPSIKPSVSPTGKPTVSPSGKPTFSPTKKPTIFPSLTPTVSPKPSGIVSPKPTMTPSGAPTATGKPTFKPTFKPTIGGGGGGMPTTYKPTYKPTIGGGGIVPTAYKPINTYKPPIGGGGGVPISTYKPPVNTYKPPSGLKPTTIARLPAT